MAFLTEKLSQLAANKEDQNYFHDSGCTPSSFTSSKPINFIAKIGSVGTAGGTVFKTLGQGKIRFGQLEMDATYCPNFTRNLVSGIQLNNNGFTQTLANDHLVVTRGPLSENSKPIATGKIDKTVGLFKMDLVTNIYAVEKVLKQNSSVNHTWEQVHEKLGHVSDATMRKTLQNVPAKPTPFCEPCALGKARRPNVSKKSNSEITVLQKISLDLQGPFRSKSYDGSQYNLKLVDNFSSYIKVEWLPTKESAPIAEAFKRFQSRMERRTGKSIKVVQVDGGEEFNGKFLEHIESHGIVKEKGDAYEHHFPGHAENAHRLLLNRGRACHLASGLPISYYAEAINYAAYTHNRTVHGKHTKSPYEYIYMQKPNLELLVPFGCVGYMYLPQEKRDKPGRLGKIEPSAKRVRFLMCGDDDDTEEIHGWKVLVEEDLTVLYTKTVRWDLDAERLPLTKQKSLLEYNLDDIYEYDDSIDHELDVSSSIMPPLISGVF